MKKHLNIDLNTLPEEGKTFSGELDPSLFNQGGRKDKDEPIATSPLFYDLYVQRFDQELLVRGALSVTIEFSCVRCPVRYLRTIDIQDCTLSHEITNSQVDLADELREEIVILYPDYPRCDEGDEPCECNLDSRYLAVDKPIDDDVKTPPRDERPNPWDALDAFDKEADKLN